MIEQLTGEAERQERTLFGVEEETLAVLVPSVIAGKAAFKDLLVGFSPKRAGDESEDTKLQAEPKPAAEITDTETKLQFNRGEIRKGKSIYAAHIARLIRTGARYIASFDGPSGYEGKSFREYDTALAAAPDRWTARFNGGESIEDIKQRVAGFIEELRTKKYDSVLIVTSLWIIFAIMASVQGLSNEEAWNLEVVQGTYVKLEI